ncbi:ubiquitin carboxyl-terminal hydrolase 2 isoform X2 [Tribolium castaneum]|uniref:ubiquitin carboxyl-terminal hydrolase 2 isoform X2 n=1 Tax=Tribolium castaneum TaxID=7070 RepID=UPI00046C0FDB|nr:PREDICTED: ubiquitin carboxyl-terminal hydrolase 2 isoform X2 [Tribolium castaneum]|eukprot:XP_008201637.1 PREDICTED: ubiquitin carboxyl-terminal hydrolase 2 isoform X2 [Tribolium castaneum]
MPVLSPRQSSASALTGSYRSTFSSSTIDRPYFGANYSPRITTFSERYTTRTYSDSDGRRIFSRSGSITEDGITSRFREEGRESSIARRESLSRDSGISSIRENSIVDFGRRDSSLSRDSPRLSSINVLDSVAELRNKYSPANYVPACLRERNNENISRSKSINDIGLPPIETTKLAKKKDISTSPKLSATSTRSAISPSTSTVNSSSSTSPSRRSSYNDDITTTATTSPIKTQGLNGLKNIGNTCFMNSVIQCLSNTKTLLEYLLQDHYVNDINTTTSAMKGSLIKAFAEVIKKLWSQDASDRVVNTSSLKSQIQRFAPRFIGYAQQDAQEFLRYLLEGLHEDVNRVKEKPKPIITEIDEKLTDSEKSAESWNRYLRMDNSKIVDYFVGQLKSTLKCTHCGHCSVTFDPFWDLSLPIPQRAGQVRLAQCLDSFTREETLDGDEKPTCSKCKERRKCTKSFTIQKFPKILVIHLKRFSLAERFRGKLSVTVDFPLEGLDMSNYAADNITPCRYNLYAISNHSGTTYSGHYTAYCRHPYTKAWHEYNDSRVSSISSKAIVSGEAYVLFYEQEGQKSHL